MVCLDTKKEKTKQWWFTGRDAVIFIQEFKKMRHIKEAEVFTELKNMGATNIAKVHRQELLATKKIWMLDIYEIDEDVVDSSDFKSQKEPLAWE